MSVTEPPKVSTRPDTLGAAWRVVSGSAARLVLTVLLIVALLLGSLLPQVPTALGSDPAVIDRWVNSTAARYGSWGLALKALDLFDIAHALWFHLLLAALGWHLLIQAAHHTVRARAALGRHRLPEVPSVGGNVAEAALAPPLRDALRRACSALSSGGLRIRYQSEHDNSTTEAQLYADRNIWGLLGEALFHISGLLILFGLLLNTVWGWRTGELRLAMGQQVDLRPEAEVSVQVSEIPLGNQRAAVVFLPESGQRVTKPLGVALPACLAGVCLHQTGDGPALRVSARGSEGGLLPLRAEDSDEVLELLLLFNQPQAERLFTVPGASLAIRVFGVTAHSSDVMGTASLVLQAYRIGNSSPVLETAIDGAATVTVGEVSLDVTPQRYVAVNARRQPGMPWLAVGALLLQLSVAVPVIWPPLQVWVTLRSERRLVAAQLVAHSDSADTDSYSAVQQLARAMGGDDVKIR